MPWPPSSNRYWRHVTIRGTPRTLESREAREYKKAVAAEFLPGTQPLTGPIAVTYTAYFPTLAGDLFNREKVISDALNGLLWVDDKQIVEGHMYRRLDRKNPRVHVEVTEVEADTAQDRP